MAHELDMSNGRANVGYIASKGVPWHGLGADIDHDASIDVWRRECGFDWEVKQTPVMFVPEGGDKPQVIPKRFALYRSDTKAPLSVVSNMFKITQPAQVMEFFRELVTIGGFRMETAGMLRGGAVYWALARYDDELNLGGKDLVRPYLLLATACDGTLSNVACFTSVRVVCANTLRMAVFDEKGKPRTDVLRIPHSTAFDETRVKTELGLIGASWSKYGKTAREMVKRRVSPEEAVQFFVHVLYPGEREVDLTKVRPALEQLNDILLTGVGQQTSTTKGTAWGLVNAVTRFVDHERKAASLDTRLQAAWFGAGHRMKQRAWKAAAALAA